MVTKSDLLRLKQMVDDPDSGLAAVNAKLNEANQTIDNMSVEISSLDRQKSTLPVGTVIHAAMSYDQFKATVSTQEEWILAQGQEASPESAFAKLGLGYLDGGKRFLPDARRYLRAPESPDNLTKGKGLLDDAVNPSGLTLDKGVVRTDVGFKNGDMSVGNSKTRILMQFAKPSSAGNGQNIMFNYFASQVLAGPAGNQMPYGLYGEIQPVSVNDPSPHVYSQASFIDRDGHGHTVDIPGKSFSGTIDSISFNGASETRPKTQLINAFVRIN